ncbi:MAG: protein kinase [archaeon]|nr:protein kinase [archaeon]
MSSKLYDFEDDDDNFLPQAEAVKRGYEEESKISDFTVIKKLGVGGFGEVNLCVYNNTKKEYAVKKMDKQKMILQNQNAKAMFRREVEIMNKVHHKHIVKLYTQFEDENYCYLVMEYIKGGNLYSYCESQPNKIMQADKAAKLICELCGTLNYLHNLKPQKIIHRDIKPENCFLNLDGELQLGDFGGSNYLENESVRMTTCGTPPYHSPEMISGKGYGVSVDIWAVGVLIFEVLCGYSPFNYNQLETNVLSLKINYPKNINPLLKDLISKILVIDVDKRLSLRQICEHEFIRQYIKDIDQYFELSDDNINYPYLITKGIYADKEYEESFHKTKITSGSKLWDEGSEVSIRVENINLKAENKNLTERIEELDKKIKDTEKSFKDKLRTLTKEKNKLESEVKIRKENENVLKKERVELISKCSNLEETNTKLQEQLRKQIKENNSNKERYEQQIKYYKNAKDLNEDDLEHASTPEHIKKILKSFGEEREFYNNKIEKYDSQIKELYDKLEQYNDFENKMEKEFNNYKEQIKKKNKQILNQNILIRKLYLIIDDISKYTDRCKELTKKSIYVLNKKIPAIDQKPKVSKRKSHSASVKIPADRRKERGIAYESKTTLRSIPSATYNQI